MRVLTCKSCGATATVIYDPASQQPSFRASCDHKLGCRLATHAIAERRFGNAFDAVDAWQAIHKLPHKEPPE